MNGYFLWKKEISFYQSGRNTKYIETLDIPQENNVNAIKTFEKHPSIIKTKAPMHNFVISFD